MRFVVVVSALALVGCGRTPEGRAISGGLLGAGAGAGVSALTGNSVGKGALIGGGIGAAGGAVTAPRYRRGHYGDGGYRRGYYGDGGYGYRY